jgi:hypothetical protein
MERAMRNRKALARFLGGEAGEALFAIALEQPGAFERTRGDVRAKLEEARRAPAEAPSEGWAIDESYEGIKAAQLVVVNIRGEPERRAAETLVEDLVRLRKDGALFEEVVGRRGNKVARRSSRTSRTRRMPGSRRRFDG